MTSQTTQHFYPWKVGDKVWLAATHLKLHYPSWKLAPKRHRLFKIIQVLSPLTYKLLLPSAWRIHNVFHVSLLLLITPLNHMDLPSLSPPPDVINHEEEYEVDAILSHKGPSNRRLFLITWKGYPSSKNTWEPEVNLSHSLILLNTYV